MKFFYIMAVVVLGLCSSCEATDQSFLDNIDDGSTVVYSLRANSVNTTDYEFYRSVVTSFAYEKEESYLENLKRYEEHVNVFMNYEEVPVYEIIEAEKLTELLNADERFIDEFEYSVEFKNVLYKIIQNETYLDLATKDEENCLLNTLSFLHNDHNIDDKLKGNRTIAFAYGAQYSLKQAVLYAGAIELNANRFN